MGQNMKFEVRSIRPPEVAAEARKVEGYFPCPFCKERLEVRLSKRDKPYTTCIRCGIQTFYRTEQGIRQLRQAKGYVKSDKEGLGGPGSRVLDEVNQLERLQEKLEEIRRNKPVKEFLGRPDDSLKLKEKALKADIERIEKKLERAARK